MGALPKYLWLYAHAFTAERMVSGGLYTSHALNGHVHKDHQSVKCVAVVVCETPRWPCICSNTTKCCSAH